MGNNGFGNVLSPLYGVNAYIHRQRLGERVLAAERQVDAPLATDDLVISGVSHTLDDILVLEIGPIALSWGMRK